MSTLSPGFEFDIFISHREKVDKYDGCGNVTSRILPIYIHPLDPADKKMLEGELTECSPVLNLSIALQV